MADDQDVRGIRLEGGCPRDDRRLLGARHQMVDEHAHPAARTGGEVPDGRVEVVDSVEHLDDDPLDAQVVAPDLLHEFGVVAALDEDARPARDLRLDALDGSRPRRRAGRRRPRGRQPRLLGGLWWREHDRPAVDEEARPELEPLEAAVPVLEVHDVLAAGLLDAHDGTDPTGGRVLDDQTRLGRDRPGSTAGGGPPVTGEHVTAITIGHGQPR